MVRRYVWGAAALALVALTSAHAVSAATASVAAGDDLSGTWQVTRACVSGCTGTTTFTEKVRPYRGTVFTATGGLTMVLYRIGTQKVLVHAAKSSSLLTIRTSGQLMRGPSVDQAGNALTVTWRCVAAPATGGSTSVAPGRGMQPLKVPAGRTIC
ncbi:MAG: hypothetical protein JOZ41_08505 [Chloroflexi bacterium]|nr:hypothetical protein [Chloroflexota bacterium]